MSYWLDFLGSFFVGAIAILILTNVNISVSSAASENLYSGVMQRNITGAVDLIEHDLYKIGYRVTGDSFSIADSTEIKFFSDINNDGTAEELHYFCGVTTDLTATYNPNDYLLTREKNMQKPGASIPVVDFKLTYFDSLGQKLDYGLLTNQSEMNKIKSVRVRLHCETADKIDDHYEAVEWEKTVTPKNI
ncbi:MAG: hypothetical protein KJN64_06950 [Ignavibacteria bacterium]|nr:hypothetical protein [Ignavibacteria bacterium]MBT8382613.1 hypothetical protein [Ignavibacteria bacterium]MBT8392890.1 hypothetical protein [Ignavibacteria bacterium]NNJ52693.1 hypothetical protein [Ignavibacteriaceae bacterium]NNL21550.1 hypothetical protein [Ignavibacteriaceae bacterium]